MIKINLFRVAWVLAFLLCSSSVAYSQALIGQDYLGLLSNRFPHDEVRRVLPERSAIGVLDVTFGSETTPLVRILDSRSPEYLRVHFLNNTCVRNRNCGTYEPLYGYSLSSLEAALLKKDPKIIRPLQARVRLYRAIQLAHPDTTFLASPILEHNLKFPAWRVLADAVLEAWPDVQLVNSPMRGVAAESYRGAWIEKHGNPAERNAKTYSLDGSDASDINIGAWVRDTKGAIISFTWTRSYNLRTQGTTWVDPRARTAAPTRRILEEMLHITDPAPSKPTPTFRCSFKPFDNTFIWKPLSEDKGTGDVRANYPVLIAKPKVTTAVLVDYKGRTAAKLGYYGKYTDGRNRYYSKWSGGSGLGGYQIQQKAKAQSGSPYVYFKVGSTCYGPILTGRRQGSYR